MPTKHFYTDGETVKSFDLTQYPDSSWDWITGKPANTKTDELYSKVASVYRVANMTADAIGNMPFAVYKGDTEVDRSDEWQNKVEFMPRPRELLRLWRLSLFMTNTAYAFREGKTIRNKYKTNNVRYIMPSTIKPVTDKNDGLTGFERKIGSETITYSLDKIFYMWRLDHTTELLPSENTEFRALMAAAGILYYSDYYIQNFFQRGGIKPAILSVKGVPTKEDKEKIERVWDKILHGWYKYIGKVFSADSVDVKVIGDGIENIKDSDLHDSKIEDIAMAAGMPLSLLLANSANYATAQIEYITWFRDSVMPKAWAMQEDMNDQLFEPAGYRFEFQPETANVGQEEERQRSSSYVNYINGGMLPSVAANMLGLELPEGKEYETLDADYVTMKEMSGTSGDDTISVAKEPEDDVLDKQEMTKATVLNIDQLRELGLWQSIATGKLNKDKSLDFPFVAKSLPENIASEIRMRLPGCKSRNDINRVFQMEPKDDGALLILADALNNAVKNMGADNG